MDTTAPLDETSLEIAKILKHQMMIEKRMTFEELEQRSSIPVTSLKRYINGQRQIRLAQFFEICSALGIDPAEVVSAVQATLSRKLENSSR